MICERPAQSTYESQLSRHCRRLVLCNRRTILSKEKEAREASLSLEDADLVGTGFWRTRTGTLWLYFVKNGTEVTINKGRVFLPISIAPAVDPAKTQRKIFG